MKVTRLPQSDEFKYNYTHVAHLAPTHLHFSSATTRFFLSIISFKGLGVSVNTPPEPENKLKSLKGIQTPHKHRANEKMSTQKTVQRKQTGSAIRHPIHTSLLPPTTAFEPLLPFHIKRWSSRASGKFRFVFF